MASLRMLMPLRGALRAVGVDRAVSFTLLSRGWLILSGLVSILLMTRMLTPIQQGVYFTFVDVLALQIFFELGLATVILQFASHERARLEWTPQGTLEGDKTAKLRLASLLRFSLIWYGVVAALVAALLLPAGFIFFARHEPQGGNIAWQLPWLWIVLVTAGSLAVSPVLSLLEGCGLVAEIAGVQLVQNIVGSALFWMTLLLHWGLYTAPVSNTVVLLGSAFWIWRYKSRVVLDLLAMPRAENLFHWRREVWPFQWKIGLSWLSGYFIFRLFVPSLYAMNLPVMAGQMGLSITITNAIAGIALAWVMTKSAPFGALIAKGDFQQLDRLFFPCLWQSFAVAVVGSIAFWAGVVYLNHIHHPLAYRVLAPLPLAFLAGTTIVSHIVASEGMYLRAHKQEPFLWLSVLNGSLVGLATYFVGRRYAALGMTASFFVIMLLVGLGGGTWVFLQKRRQWHENSSERSG